MNRRLPSSSLPPGLFERCSSSCSMALAWVQGVAWTSAYGEFWFPVVLCLRACTCATLFYTPSLRLLYLTGFCSLSCCRSFHYKCLFVLLPDAAATDSLPLLLLLYVGLRPSSLVYLLPSTRYPSVRRPHRCSVRPMGAAATATTVARPAAVVCIVAVVA